jgi:hypothetical protein
MLNEVAIKRKTKIIEIDFINKRIIIYELTNC